MPGVLAWGYYPTTGVWLPIKVDSAGRVQADMSNINLDDLADVSVASPTDGHVLYYDAGTGLWKCKAPYTSPLTTLGDLLRRGASADERLAIGSNGQVLTVVSGQPAWAAGAGGTKIQDADADTKVDTEESTDEDNIRMDVKGVEAFRIHASGILDYPKQSMAKAYLSGANQALPSGAITLVNLNAESFDVQGEFNTTTHRFTVTKPGKYLVVAAIVISDVTVDHQGGIYIYKNGGVVYQINQFASVTSDLTFQALNAFDLAAEDYIELKAWQNTGSAQEILEAEQYTMLTVVKIA